METLDCKAEYERIAAFYLKYQKFLKSKTRSEMEKIHLIDGSDLSEDLIQDSIIKIMQNAQITNKLNDYQLLSYIIKTLQSCTIDYYKKLVKNKRSEQEKRILEETCVYENDPFRFYGEPSNIYYLKSVLNCLPTRDQKILFYKYLLNYSNNQISHIMNIKPDSVRMALTRARRKAKMIWKQEIDLNI